MYLANRGYKTANVPLVPHLPLPRTIDHLRRPLIVGLVASADRIVQIRQNRLLSLNADSETEYVDRIAVAEEVAASRRLFADRTRFRSRMGRRRGKPRRLGRIAGFGAVSPRR
jgi:regulator of PEP synthase PpsR (kinase-PPPase family)